MLTIPVLLLMTQMINTHMDDESKLPQAPAGFSWFEVPDARASFLRPDGWHTKIGTRDGTVVCYVTPEPVRNDQLFEVGLTVNTVLGRPDLDAVEYCRLFVDGFRSRGIGGDVSQERRGSFAGYSCTVQIKGDGGDFTVYVLALGDRKAGDIYIVQFEAPVAVWDRWWKVGKVITDRFVLGGSGKR